MTTSTNTNTDNVTNSNNATSVNCFDTILRATCVALLVVTAIVNAGITVYGVNGDSFVFAFSDIFLPLGVFGATLFCFLFLFQFPFFKTRYFYVTNYIIFCIGLVLYFQSNWLLWNLGPLLNGEFWWDWKTHGVMTIIEVVFYLILFSVLLYFCRLFYKNLIKISCAFILIQMMVCLPFFFQDNIDCSYKHYTIVENNKYVFAKEHNLIICVFDSFSTPLMNEIFRQNPEEQEAFNDFTMYPFMYSKGTCTQTTIPSILTGIDNIDTDKKLLKEQYHNADKSILVKLTKQHFKNEIYPFATWTDAKQAIYFDKSYLSNIQDKNEIDVAQNFLSWKDYINSIVLRVTPLRLKGRMASLTKQCFIDVYSKCHSNQKIYFSDRNTENLQFYKELKQIATVGNESKVFKYYHLRGVHTPFDIDENINICDFRYPDRMYIPCGKGCVKIMKEMIHQFKKLGIYDNSMIIFMGDHGRYDNMFGNYTDFPSEHNPLFMVKLPQEKHNKIVINNNILLETDITQMPIWKNVNSTDIAKLGDNFSKEQINERLLIWKNCKKTLPSWSIQKGKFTQSNNKYNFDKPVCRYLKNPDIEGSSCTGRLQIEPWSTLTSNQFDLVLASNEKCYSTTFDIAHQRIQYSCDLSAVEDGTYLLYYALKNKQGYEMHWFTYCQIIVTNGNVKLNYVTN